MGGGNTLELWREMLLESLKDFAVLSEAFHRKLQVKSKPRGLDLASSISMLRYLGSYEPHFSIMNQKHTANTSCNRDSPLGAHRWLTILLRRGEQLGQV